MLAMFTLHCKPDICKAAIFLACYGVNDLHVSFDHPSKSLIVGDT